MEDDNSDANYRPAPEERAEGFRHAALHTALEFNRGLTRDAATVVRDAKVFESFLKGE